MSFKDYQGYTHPVPIFLLPVWKRIMCKKNIHAFDEVANGVENYLYCDACDIKVVIQTIEKEFL